MKITRNNYEPWFLDYLEGNLDKKMVDEFIEFVSQNPDLREELQLFEPVAIVEDSICYDGKKKLYKELFDLPAEFENTAVALLEGDLNPEQAVMFEDYLILHPEKHSELELFRQTILNPDSTLVFSLKHQLYRQPIFRQLMGWSARVAAVLLLVFTIFTLADQSERNTGNELISPRNPVVSESKAPVKEISVEKNTEPGQLIASSTHKAKPQISKITRTEKYREKASTLQEDNLAVPANSRIETPVLISAIHGLPESTFLTCPCRNENISEFRIYCRGTTGCTSLV